MANEIGLAIIGAIVVAMGVWRVRVSAGVRRVAMIGLIVGGAVVVGMAAFSAGGDAIGFMAFFAFLGAGAGMGATLGQVSNSKRGGVVLAELGKYANTALKVTSLGSIALSVACIAISTRVTRSAQETLFYVGQGLLFTTSAVDSVLTMRSRWKLADGGVVGPQAFVPWTEVAYGEWPEPTTLAIGLKPGLRRLGSRMLIPVPSDVRERAAAVLANKIPSANASPLQ